MNEHRSEDANTLGDTPAPRATVARAVQRMAAGAVRRALVPLGGLGLVGVVELLRRGADGTAMVLVAGAISSGLVMLAYGVQSVRRVLGRPAGAWRPLFWVASWIPYLYGIWVVFLLGLRPLVTSGFDRPIVEVMLSVVLVLLGVLLIRAQWRLSEVHLLSQQMTDLVPGSGPESWEGEVGE